MARVIPVADEFGDSAKFFEALGSGSAEDIPESDADDIEAEVAANREVKLYKVSDAEGDVEVVEVSGRPLKQGMLDQSVSHSTQETRTDGIIQVHVEVNTEKSFSFICLWSTGPPITGEDDSRPSRVMAYVDLSNS